MKLTTVIELEGKIQLARTTLESLRSVQMFTTAKASSSIERLTVALADAEQRLIELTAEFAIAPVELADEINR